MTVCLNKELVTTMGGVKILPDFSVAEIAFTNAALILLPCSYTWHDPPHKAILQIVPRFKDAGILVAVIAVL